MDLDMIGKISAARNVGDSANSKEGASYEVKDEVEHSIESTVTATVSVTESQKQDGNDKKEDEKNDNKKFPSKSSVDAMITTVNQQLRATRCEYKYNEPTKSVAIKVFDKESGKLIREVPSEKSLEALQKMLELAGIIVDEKR